ncbi:hypothetical protein Sjap_007115 [Stephania japonica]|uniref:Uncharacterized protein n=1 Tax=Stephania japonica TaxID=461633 RepID=A0AAP0JLZ4_9MAGN
MTWGTAGDLTMSVMESHSPGASISMMMSRNGGDMRVATVTGTDRGRPPVTHRSPDRPGALPLRHTCCVIGLVRFGSILNEILTSRRNCRDRWFYWPDHHAREVVAD